MSLHALLPILLCAKTTQHNNKITTLSVCGAGQRCTDFKRLCGPHTHTHTHTHTAFIFSPLMVFGGFSQKPKTWNYTGDPLYCEIFFLSVSLLASLFSLFCLNPLCVVLIISLIFSFWLFICNNSSDKERKKADFKVKGEQRVGIVG